jgi:hypothetical protein
MGFEDEVEQSKGRPYRQTNDRSKRTCELTSSIVPRGTHLSSRDSFDFHVAGSWPMCSRSVIAINMVCERQCSVNHTNTQISDFDHRRRLA